MATTEEELESVQADDPATTAIKKRASRRQLLKLAGAAVAGAAGAAAVKAVPVAAADGDTMRVGYVIAEQFTNYASGVNAYNGSNYGALLGETSNGIGTRGITSNYGTGVLGQSYGYGRGVQGSSTYGTGVVGYGGGYGVWGHAQFAGLVGYSTATHGFGGFGMSTAAYGSGLKGVAGAAYSLGVYGFANTTGSTGVYGYSANFWAGYFVGAAGSYSVAFGSGSPAVEAISFSGPDVLMSGTGRLVQTYNGSGPGAPNFSPSGGGYFESVRTNDGGVWASTGSGSGQAAWKRINTLRVDTADGTGGTYVPFRILDTRGPLGNQPKKAAHSTTTVNVAGQGSGAQTIPSTAIAVVGNVTATGWTAGGYLTIVPHGVTNPATSTVNFGGNQLPGIANSFVCGLSGGALDVVNGPAATHFIIDITGYIQ